DPAAVRAGLRAGARAGGPDRDAQRDPLVPDPRGVRAGAVGDGLDGPGPDGGGPGAADPPALAARLERLPRDGAGPAVHPLGDPRLARAPEGPGGLRDRRVAALPRGVRRARRLA